MRDPPSAGSVSAGSVSAGSLFDKDPAEMDLWLRDPTERERDPTGREGSHREGGIPQGERDPTEREGSHREGGIPQRERDPTEREWDPTERVDSPLWLWGLED